jgi:hypothetical protein
MCGSPVTSSLRWISGEEQVSHCVVARDEGADRRAQVVEINVRPSLQALFLERPDEPVRTPIVRELSCERRGRLDPQPAQRALEVPRGILRPPFVPHGDAPGDVRGHLPKPLPHRIVDRLDAGKAIATFAKGGGDPLAQQPSTASAFLPRTTMLLWALGCDYRCPSVSHVDLPLLSGVQGNRVRWTCASAGARSELLGDARDLQARFLRNRTSNRPSFRPMALHAKIH